MTDSPYWKHLGPGKYETIPPSPGTGPKDGYLECSLAEFGVIRNARVAFKISVLDGTPNFHAALLFRKNGIKYLGAGLGGWDSYYSVFNRALAGFLRFPIGSSTSISVGHTYAFVLEFRGGFITKFEMNGETLFPFQGLSIRESLRSTISSGRLGLYAYDRTRAMIELDVTPLPSRCFIITNIDPPDGSDTDKRRAQFVSILDKSGITNVQFLDSRDLTREHRLMLKIRSAIVESDFVISDLGLGEPRGNVHYETGIAHSVGIPTIHIGPAANKFPTVPSDLKQQFFILEHEVSAKLPETIRAILDTPSGEFDYL